MNLYEICGSEDKMEEYFDKIIKHLNRKKPTKTPPKDNNSGDWIITKPIINISNDGKCLYCFYGVHYLYIYYNDKKVWNPYEISIESQCVFARYQTVGISFYDDVAPTQEDVIECIRYRLRK